MAEMNPNPGIAPADAKRHRPWPAWKIALAYGVMFGIAVGSIWVIDDHVLKATPPPANTITGNPLLPAR